MSRKLRVLVLLTFFLSVTGVSAYWFWIRASIPTAGPNADGKLRVLILGVDPGWSAPGKPGIGRSDTIMLATYDPKAGGVSLLSIPRDSRVEIPGHGLDKINAAYAFGGVELARQTVQDFLKVPIRYYLKVDVTGFARLVDAIGGVTIDVAKDMDWDDNAGNLHIHLKKGLQTLDGKNALDYVRFRHTDSDLVRASRQQGFIAAAIKQVLKPANLLKIPELVRIGFATVQTNVPLTTVLRQAPKVPSIKDNITSYTVEGTSSYIKGISYFLPDLDKLDQLIETYLYTGVDRVANSEVKVAIRYGNGDRESANQVAELLQKLGFQVQGVTAADNDNYLVTQVLSVKKDTAGAVRVAEAISAPEVLLDPATGTGVDVIVILGKDMPR